MRGRGMGATSEVFAECRCEMCVFVFGAAVKKKSEVEFDIKIGSFGISESFEMTRRSESVTNPVSD